MTAQKYLVTYMNDKLDNLNVLLKLLEELWMFFVQSVSHYFKLKNIYILRISKSNNFIKIIRKCTIRKISNAKIRNCFLNVNSYGHFILQIYHKTNYFLYFCYTKNERMIYFSYR